MRVKYSLILLVTIAASSVGLTQEVMCDPCMDYPEWRSPIPELVPSPGIDEIAAVDDRFNLGTSIANLRGLNKPSGPRTLGDPVEESSDGVVTEGEAEDDISDGVRTDNVGSRNEELDQGAEAIKSSDQ